MADTSQSLPLTVLPCSFFPGTINLALPMELAVTFFEKHAMQDNGAMLSAPLDLQPGLNLCRPYKSPMTSYVIPLRNLLSFLIHRSICLENMWGNVTNGRE